MDYLLVGGGILLYLAGGFTVFLVFRKNILPELFRVNSHKGKGYTAPEDFYRVLAANTDFSLYENTTEAIELERRRIGTDVHDELAPYLGSLYIDLELVIGEGEILSSESIRLLGEMRPKIKSTIESLRKIIFGMVPTALANRSLSEALKELSEKNDGIKGTHILFSSDGMPFTLTEQEQLYLYRIVQELLNNSIKHSLAWYIYIVLKWSEEELTIIVKDNGVGLPKLVKNVSSYGMTGIFVRSKIIGASAKFNVPSIGMEFELKLLRKKT